MICNTGGSFRASRMPLIYTPSFSAFRLRCLYKKACFAEAGCSWYHFDISINKIARGRDGSKTVVCKKTIY
jgi:hypothetical protein